MGTFKVANAFGLYDMHGNVWEWCADFWHDNYEGAPTDSSASWQGNHGSQERLLRGGSWRGNPNLCRSAYRSHSDPEFRINNVGFRIAYSAAWNL